MLHHALETILRNGSIRPGLLADISRPYYGVPGYASEDINACGQLGWDWNYRSPGSVLQVLPVENQVFSLPRFDCKGWKKTLKQKITKDNKTGNLEDNLNNFNRMLRKKKFLIKKKKN